jgi:STE24 endopeptidase
MERIALDRRTRLAAALGAAFLAGSMCLAQEPTPEPAAAEASPEAAAAPAEEASLEAAAAPAAETAPEAAPPAGRFDPAAATEAYLAGVPAETRARSDAYFEGGYWLQLAGYLYGAVVLLLLLSLGWSAGMRDRAERWTRFKPLRSLIYWLQYLVLTTVLFFPLSVYADFIREHRYGLATQSFAEWLLDQLKGLGVSAVLGGLLLVLLYGVLRRTPRTWWLWGSAVFVAFVVFTLTIGPVYIAPIFNTYTRLEDPKIRDPILRMARANGVNVDAVYQFDASRQHNRISANVSGILGTDRISLNDNLLKRCTLPEIEAVMGHEIGHYALGHIYESMVFFSVLIVAGFGFVRWGFGRLAGRWNIREVSDLAGLPLGILLLMTFFFVLTPILNTYIRTNEAEADIFGLNAARQPDGFATTALKLAEYRKLDPGPIEEWIFYDHPSGRSRIAMAMHWKAAQLGEPQPAPAAPGP